MRSKNAAFCVCLFKPTVAIPPARHRLDISETIGVRGVRSDKVYGTNLDQVGPKKASLDQLGQVDRRFAVFCLLRKAPLTNLDQVGPVLFPTVFRALPKTPVTVTPQQEISKTLNSSKIPKNTQRLLLGNERLLLGNERLLLGVIEVFGFFFEFPFLLLGGFRTPWVGGPRRLGVSENI